MKSKTAFALGMMLALIGANVAAVVMPQERGHEPLRFEPPHVRFLARSLWRRDVKDTVVVATTFDDLGPRSTTVDAHFDSDPLVIARPGQPYEYRPHATAPLSAFEIEGAPDGITIDTASGVISGTLRSEGRYDIVVRAHADASHRVEQSFPLFVDSRFLLLGSDKHGRDVLRRLVSSSKYVVVPGLVAVLVSVLGGAIFGALGGFYSGTAARLLTAGTTVVQAVPGLLVVFLVAVISGFNVYWTMVAVGLVLLPETANGVLGQVQRLREHDFIEAAREIGMRDRTILWNEIVWHNTRAFLLSRAAQGFIFAVLVDVTLSYMGLVDPNTPRLGSMLLEGRTALDQGMLLAIAPLVALLLVISAFSIVEVSLSRAWDDTP